jgi:hypothetical protein
MLIKLSSLLTVERNKGVFPWQAFSAWSKITLKRLAMENTLAYFNPKVRKQEKKFINRHPKFMLKDFFLNY